MVSVGQEMSNPITGERFVWRDTRESTAGGWCEFDLHLAADAKVAAPHRHPRQEERFTVIRGALQVDVDGARQIVGPGATVLVPAGSAHRWDNAESEESVVRVRLTPALHIEDYFEAFCAFAMAGRASSLGVPRNPLQLAVLLDAHRAEFALPTDRGQRLVSPLLAVLGAAGRRLGYTPTGPNPGARGTHPPQNPLHPDKEHP